MNGKIRKKLPEIKRDIKDFISDERGLVSKDKILKASFALGIASLLLSGGAVADHTDHSNSVSGSFNPTTNTVSGSHGHHGSHTSY